MTLSNTLRVTIATAVLALTVPTMGHVTRTDKAFAAEAAGAANVDPVHIYAQLPRTSSVRVSPDGKYVAMLAPFRGSKAVFVYNLKNPEANTIIIPTPEGSIVKVIDWASDKHVIMLARIRDNIEGGKMKRYSNLFERWISTNVETQKSTQLMDKKIKNLGYKSKFGGSFVHDFSSDPDHILMGMGEWAGKPLLRHYKVNLDTGKARMYKTLPINSNRVIRSLDGSKVLARSEYDDRSGKFEVFVGEYPDDKLAYETKFANKDRPTMSLFTILDGKPILLESEKKELTLHKLDPATRSLSPFKLNADVPSGYSYGPMFDIFTGKLIGVSYTDDLSRQAYSAEPYKSWHAKAKKALKGKNVRILSRTRDNSMVTLFAESPTSAGEYYLFEPDKGRIESLGGSYPELKSSMIAKTIRADYTARDGLNIPAYLTYPPGKSKASDPLPMVVLPHGGPIGPRDDAAFDFWAQHIATQGYVVFKPQFRGSGGFGNDFREKGFGEFGAGMLDDTIDGVNHLIDTGVAKADKICVTGASYGGYQALALPMVEPDMFKCAIAVNGVSDLPAMFKYEIAKGGHEGGNVKWWERVMGDYYDDRDLLEKQSPAEHLDKIKAEILLVHGSDDATVPYKQAEIMSKALKKAGRPHEILILEDDDHNLSLPQSRLKLLEASEELFAKHLK